MRNNLKRVLSAWLCIAIIVTGFFAAMPANVLAVTEVRGHISEDTVWTLAGSPYLVVRTIYVDKGVTLTIEPGVEVKFSMLFGPHSFYVNGILLAVGTADHRIVFTSSYTPPSFRHWEEIQINPSGYCKMEFCDVSYCYDGIQLIGTSNNTIVNCHVSNTGFYGITLHNSSGNTITDCELTNTQSKGITLREHSSNNVVERCKISRSCFPFFLDHANYNLINECEIESSRHGIYTFRGSYNIITMCNLTNAGGIYITGSNNIVANCTSIRGGCGIDVCGYNNIVENCTSSLNYYWGVFLCLGGNNTLRNCHIEENRVVGIRFWGGIGNEIINTTIRKNPYGIFMFYGGYDNIIRECNISQSSYGITILSPSKNNLIYHNNFVNNSRQAYSNRVNQWDDGYPSGGNYWSDYVGEDHFRGPNQNISGSDGIGDIPYDFEYGEDRYPLISPWQPYEAPEISIEKEFIPSEITTITQEVVSAINITNIGDLDITSMTITDEYVENMALNELPEVLVTITSDEGKVYAIKDENLTITTTNNNITISFELPLEIVPVFWENGTLSFGEENYYLESIPKDWVVGAQYLLYPLTELEIGTYSADATITAYGEAGESTTGIVTGTLIISEPIETAP